MHAVGGVDAPARRLQHPLAEHHPRAVEALLAGLEHEHDVALEPVAVACEQPGRPDQRRRVQVVPAGVHRAVRRGEVKAGLLVDGQRVHVAADQDRTGVAVVASPAAQHADDRRGPGSGRDLEAEAVELGEHPLLGVRQLEADLRVAVQRLPQLDEVSLDRGGIVAE